LTLFCPGRLAAKLRAIEEVFEGDEQGCSSSGSSESAEGRRQALARAHAHAQKTLAEGFAMQEALSKIALSKKIKWRTSQPARMENDDVSPGSRSTSQIKWRTVAHEPAKSCDDPDGKERLKQTKALTVGISRDRMCTSPTSQRVRPAGWVSSKLDQEEELGLLEDEEELADPLDGEGLEAGERPQGSLSTSRIKWRTVVHEPAKSCDDPGGKERLKQTKALTVGISRDRMCTSPTSQRVRPVGWVSSKLDQEEESGLLEDEEELADPLDGEGLEAGERPQGSSSMLNRSGSRTCMSEGEGLTAPETLHTRAVRNLEALARKIETYEMARSCESVSE